MYPYNNNDSPVSNNANIPPQNYSPAPPPPPTSDKTPQYLRMRKYVLITIGSIFGLALLFCVYAIFDIPPLNEIENPQSDLSTQIISANGEQLGTLYSDENRVGVKLNEISDFAMKALIATEDHRFTQHAGVDQWSLPALVASALKGDPRGGSTITMQLTRNLYAKVGKERTPFRKLKEYLVSTYIERSFTKEEIITAYFNTVNIYGNDYGIETAANRLFSKHAKDLKLEEATLLVGMLKGPGYYSPIKHPERALLRRNTVLEEMVEHQFISKKMADSIKLKPITLNKGSELAHNVGIAPYFREYIRQTLKDWCNAHGYDPYSDGLKVYTTIDSRMQRYAEEAVKDHVSTLQKQFDPVAKSSRHLNDPKTIDAYMRKSYRYLSAKKQGKTEGEILKEFNTAVRMDIFSWKKGEVKDTLMTPRDSLKYYGRFIETGFVSIEPTTGHIKAWVGGISYKYFKYDHVGVGKRQVGSTFKPFVYATAIDNGKMPCDMEMNQPVVIEWGGKRWSPKNSDGSVGGYMTLKDALAGSVNLVTARLMKEYGPKVIAEYAKNLGIESKLELVPSLCLGTTDLTVLELVGAYCSFANKGVFIKPMGIIRIEDRNGNVLEEFIPITRKALSEEKAYTMIDMLKGVVDQERGTAHRLRYRYKFKAEIAGKTGTTQDNADGWFVGMTPNLVSGVWGGCADKNVRSNSTAFGQGANIALPIWALYMQKVYADKTIGMPQEPFEKPDGWNGKCSRTGSDDPIDASKYYEQHKYTDPTEQPVTPNTPVETPPVQPPKKSQIDDKDFDN